MSDFQQMMIRAEAAEKRLEALIEHVRQHAPAVLAAFESGVKLAEEGEEVIHSATAPK